MNRHLSRIHSTMIIAAGAGAVLGSSALADTVAPGASVTLGGTTPTLSPWLQGVSPGGTTRFFEVRDASNAVVFSGTLLVSYVDANPFGRRYANYRFQGTSGVAGRAISKVEFSGWGVNTVDTEYRSDFAPAPAPGAAERSPDGDTLTLTFGAPLAPTQTSQFFYIFTGAPTVASTGSARIVLNTGESAMVSGLPVPAPLVACDGDTNGDGVINFTDLNGVLTNFGEICP